MGMVPIEFLLIDAMNWPVPRQWHTASEVISHGPARYSPRRSMARNHWAANSSELKASCLPEANK